MMKKTFYAASVFAALGLTACGGAEEVETTEAEEVVEVTEETYVLNAEETQLKWVGSWIVPGEDGEMMEVKNHDGTVDVSEGQVTVMGDNITGTFIVDMSTINNADLADEPEEKAKLEGHLKADDFFNVEEYAKVGVMMNGLADGVADFTINVMGTDINVSTPVELKEDGDKKMMHAEFAVDFSALQMPMTMGNPEKPEDGMVNPEISFHLHLVVDKQ